MAGTTYENGLVPIACLRGKSCLSSGHSSSRPPRSEAARTTVGEHYELRGLNQLIPYAEYARSHGSKSVARQAAADPAPGDQQDLRQQSANHAAQAKTATGWLKSRFESCQKLVRLIGHQRSPADVQPLPGVHPPLL